MTAKAKRGRYNHQQLYHAMHRAVVFLDLKTAPADATPLEKRCFDLGKKDLNTFMTRLYHLERTRQTKQRKASGKPFGKAEPDQGTEKVLVMLDEWFVRQEKIGYARQPGDSVAVPVANK